MGKNNIIVRIVFFFLFVGFGYGQGNTDPRNEGQYMDYTTMNMPESPTASAFNIVEDIQVNPAKGIPNISIPIYTYELDGVQVPISLSYDASGIKVSQMATSVGLGWSLVAGGQISRTVRSRPDEENIDGWFADGYLRSDYYMGKDQNDKDWQQEMKGHASTQYKTGLAKRRDHNPDLFSYSFLGHSGTYIHDTEGNIIKEQNDGITITAFANSDDSLEASDLEGNKYYFNMEHSERSSNHNLFHDLNDLALDFYEWEGENGLDRITAWKLSEITTKNNKNVLFEYESEEMEYTQKKASWQVTVGYGCANGGSGESNTVKSASGTTITNSFNTQLIKKIHSPHHNIEIEFEYASDSGLPDSVWKTKLTKIVVTDKDSGNKREFLFEYGRFSGDPRLKLKKIYEVGHAQGNSIQKPPYEFGYLSGVLPSKVNDGQDPLTLAYAQDMYGYFNQVSGNTSLVPKFTVPHFQTYIDAQGGNRNINSNALKIGTLNMITYPSGGYTYLEYEPNVENLYTNSGYRGGLRVKETKNFDENGTMFHRKVYSYSGLTGLYLDTTASQWLMKQEGNTWSVSSGPIRIPGDIAGYKTGFFYGKVTVVSHGNTVDENFKIEYKYKENPYNVQSYEHVLESETIFKGVTSNRLKVVEYEHDIISSTGNVGMLQWNVLGDMICFKPPSWLSKFAAMGYTTTPRTVQFSGNYAYLPTRIATTEFPEGSASDGITVVRDIAYDPGTLLKKTETTDLQRRRDVAPDGTVSYPVNDSNAERIVVDYTYPFEVPDLSSLPNFPKGTVVRQEVTTTKGGQTAQTGGKAYAFDPQGNIKTIYGFEKGQGSNSSPLSYVPSNYGERTNFIFSDGHPVQVAPKGGIPTSYIWNLPGNVPVAKIEGLPRGLLDQSLIAQLENASFAQLPALLAQLRTSLSSYGIAFLTTFAHRPLAGVEAITDPKGDRTAFEYDAFGRLRYVRDAEGNILEETEYNYGLD